ncbi:M23 family metallopeptidase [Cryptosporangium phraense]|uniref:M23 family metallopeptidase n=1 Tax=Cryptosporangium phraense TaxID=2593070 RepID=A0A545AK49_9ACTN|nr:M23 family metallopeptidase [Cryptosporangium phraense]TQS41651.1 M23 family metallopeptidase [Cryptosporangium phraense]
MAIDVRPETAAPPEQNPNRLKKLVIIGICVIAAGSLLCLGFTPMVFSGIVQSMRDSAENAQEGCGSLGFTVDDDVKIDGLAADQLQNAATIVGVGQKMQVPPRGWVIALATALQESLLHNYTVATDHDSVGLFQQRPSSGWGNAPATATDTRTPAQRLADPSYASAKFYEKLLRQPGWNQRRLAEVAQAVQISAFPERYARWESFATLLVNRLTKGAANGVVATQGDPIRCATPGQITGAGWTVPALGQVGSGFRPPDRPSHQGVDIIVPRFTVIHAASAGIVITSKCNASTGNCDVDGGISVKGCGWYVEIAHTSGLTTRYCHMVERPLVQVGQTVVAGQPLGRVGSSGNSSGPHLHFETRVNGDAVNPIPFMAARGAPLGTRQ